MKFRLKQFIAFSVISLSSQSSSGSGSQGSGMQVSPNNTILQNLYALAMNQTSSQNATLSYISLLLGLNTLCTSNVTQMLNSSSGNYTFFAPSDQAFRAIPGFPDFGPNFCDNCGGEGGKSNRNPNSGGLLARFFQSDQGPLRQQHQGQCPKGCNDTSLSLNATSSQLMPCLPQILQYHLLNESVYFNSTSFGFLNRSSYNLTVTPTMLNSSCLVNLANSSSAGNNQSNETMGSVGPVEPGVGALQQDGSSWMNDANANAQVLVFNITNSGNNTGSGSSGSSSFNVTILHGINRPANVTIFDIPSSNGVLHVIDALLIPPANMTETINTTYATSSSNSSTSESFNSSGNATSSLPSFLNQTELEMYNNMSGITVFLPETTNNTGSSNNTIDASNFNLTNYIFPTLLYNNRSFEVIGNLSDGVFFQQNLTNLNGDNVTVLFGRNNAMLFNGSRVTQSNILMKNGVLHFFSPSESIFGGGSGNAGGSNNTLIGLGRILRG